MTTNIQIPVTLRPSRRNRCLLILTCLLLSIGGFWSASERPILGWFFGVFFALCVIVMAVELTPGSAYLVLTAEGFTFCALFRPHSVRWDQVGRFFVTRTGGQKFVAWDFKRGAAGPGSSVAKALAGAEAALPDTYGMRAEELAGVLNDLRNRFAG